MYLNKCKVPSREDNDNNLRIDNCDAGPFWSAQIKPLYIFWSCIYYSVLYIIRKPKERALWKY